MSSLPPNLKNPRQRQRQRKRGQYHHRVFKPKPSLPPLVSHLQDSTEVIAVPQLKPTRGRKGNESASGHRVYGYTLMTMNTRSALLQIRELLRIHRDGGFRHAHARDQFYAHQHELSKPLLNISGKNLLWEDMYDPDTGWDMQEKEAMFNARAAQDSTISATRERYVTLVKRRILHRQRRIRQAVVWQTEVLPTLIKPYLEWHEYEFSSSKPAPSDPPVCTCGGLNKKEMKITLVSLFSHSSREFHSCACKPICVTLVRAGFFPCAPIRPSLAFDLNFLELMDVSGFYMAPNVFGWSRVITELQRRRGFEYETKDSVNRRLCTAILWYQTMCKRSEAYIKEQVSVLAENANGVSSAGIVDGKFPDTTDAHNHPMCVEAAPNAEEGNNDQEPMELDRDHDVHRSDQGVPATKDDLFQPSRVSSSPSSSLTGPSPYLKELCRPCFNHRITPKLKTSPITSVVSMDGCFKGKRYGNETDVFEPQIQHPRTRWIPPVEVLQMRQLVEDRRGAPQPVRATHYFQRPRPTEETVAECQESFKAAHQQLSTSTTTSYDDTGIMMMVCRHDIPLFFANIDTPGERQYYALALIKALFDHLPSDWVCGIMYDIGCNLETSMIKYGFLDHLLPRMVIAVPVLHAFGHQMSCQVMYHPQKCEGFGCTDGEGCERVWAACKNLIPSTRHSSLQRREFAYDHHVDMYTEMKQRNMGYLFHHKKYLLSCKVLEADQAFSMGGLSREEVSAQWADQVEYQSKALPSIGKRSVKNLIGEMVLKQKHRKKMERSLATVKRKIDPPYKRKTEPLPEQMEQWLELEDDLTIRLERSQRECARLEARVFQINTECGIPQAELDSEFGQHLACMSLIRQRLMRGLACRRLELSPLVRIAKSSSSKMASNLYSNFNKRKENVTKLVTRYNNMREEAEKIRDRLPRQGVLRIPEPLDPEELWRPDADGQIFVDPALDWPQGLQVPDWLAKKTVRTAIRGELLFRRCNEEEERLEMECNAMERWLDECLDELTLTYDLSRVNPVLHYHIGRLLSNHKAIYDDWFYYHPRPLQAPVDDGLPPDVPRPIRTQTDVRRDMSAADEEACSSDDEDADDLEPAEDDPAYMADVEEKMARNAASPEPLSDDEEQEDEDEDGSGTQKPQIIGEVAVAIEYATISNFHRMTPPTPRIQTLAHLRPIPQPNFQQMLSEPGPGSVQEKSSTASITIEPLQEVKPPKRSVRFASPLVLGEISHWPTYSEMRDERMTMGLDDPILPDIPPDSPHASTSGFPCQCRSIAVRTKAKAKAKASTSESESAALTSNAKSSTSVEPDDPMNSNNAGVGTGHFLVGVDWIKQLNVDTELWARDDMLNTLAEWFSQRYPMPTSGTLPVVPVPSQLWLSMELLLTQEKKSVEIFSIKSAIIHSSLGLCRHPYEVHEWLVPICRNRHWTYARVNFIEQTVTFVDSKWKFSKSRKQEHWDILSPILQLVYDVFQLGNFDLSEYAVLVDSRAPRQTNGIDCGFFVLADFESLMERGCVADISQKDMPEYRKKCYNILSKLPRWKKKPMPKIPNAERYPPVRNTSYVNLSEDDSF